MTFSAFGEPIERIDDPTSPFYVPRDQQLDHDSGPDSDALTPETGDDLDGWQPGDPIEELPASDSGEEE